MNHKTPNTFNMSTRSRNGPSYMSTAYQYDTKVSSDHLGQGPNTDPSHSTSSVAAGGFTSHPLLYCPTTHCVPSQLQLHPGYYFDPQSLPQLQIPAVTYTQYHLQNYNGTQPLLFDTTGLHTSAVHFNGEFPGYGPIFSTENSDVQDSFLYDGSRESSILSSPYSSTTAHIWTPILSTNESLTSSSNIEYASFTTSPVSVHQEVDSNIDMSAVDMIHPNNPMRISPFDVITNAGQYTQTAPYEPPTISAMFALPFPSSPLTTISTMSTIFHHDSNWTAPAVPSSSYKAEKTSATSGRSTITKTERQQRKSTAVGPAFRVQKTTKAVVRKEPKDWELAVVELHEKGWKYEEIQKMIEEKYGAKKALSTLRGTKRNIVVPKELRPRSPKWEDIHIEAMFEGIPLATVKVGSRREIRWTLVSQYILDKTGRSFGPNNVHATFERKCDENAAAAAEPISLAW